MNPISPLGKPSGTPADTPSAEPPGTILPDNLPLLTQVVKEEPPADLPTLTEIVTEPDTVQEAPDKPAPRAFSDEEMQQLLLQLGAHLETVFTIKLNLHLEQLQQQAIEQAVNELKAELPELLRGALNAHPEL